MDPQDLAIKETKNRLKNGILQIDPTDMQSIKTLEEIQARATVIILITK